MQVFYGILYSYLEFVCFYKLVFQIYYNIFPAFLDIDRKASYRYYIKNTQLFKCFSMKYLLSMKL